MKVAPGSIAQPAKTMVVARRGRTVIAEHDCGTDSADPLAVNHFGLQLDTRLDTVFSSSPMTPIKITRQELYERVWSAPITKLSARRALTLLEAIVRAGEQRGWWFESVEKASISVHIAEDTVAFGIEERVTRTEQPAKPDEKRYAWMSKKYDHHPTGLLTIRIFDHLGNGGRRSSWNDGKRQRLEAQLGDVIAGMETASEYLRKRRLEHEEWKRQCAERERARQALAIRINAERDRREELLKQSENLATAAKIRNLAQELRSRSPGDPERFHPEDVGRWSEWALRVARWYDPFERAYFEKALKCEQLEGELHVPDKGSFW